MSKKVEAYFAQTMDWDKQQRLRIIKRSIRNGRLAWANGCLAALAIGAIFFLMPLKTFTPVVIRVDELSGAYDVSSTGWMKASANDPMAERRKIADLTRYVSSREGFSRAEADKNYKTVYMMSCDSERNVYNAYIRPESNPSSPLKTMGPMDKEEVAIQNITFLPTDRDDLHVAQVRFDKTTLRGTSAPTVTRFISTISYDYRKANVPSDVADMQYNAFGMCVLQYRHDQEGPTRLVKPASDGAPQPPTNTPLQPVQLSNNPAGAR